MITDNSYAMLSISNDLLKIKKIIVLESVWEWTIL